MKRSLLIITTLCMFFMVYKGCDDPSMKDSTRACKVLGKMHEAAGYKVSARWLLILETEGRRFDLSVTPDTYWVAKEGETMYFSISERDIDSRAGSAWYPIMALGGFFGAAICIATLAIYWNDFKTH
jgi:hypothetical protein